MPAERTGATPAPAARAPSPEGEERRVEAARKSAIDRAARSATPSTRAPASTQDANDRRAYKQLQQNEALRTQQRILEELRARGAL